LEGRAVRLVKDIVDLEETIKSTGREALHREE